MIARAVRCLFVLGLLANGSAHAQNDIENVIVETYYISDANDATDTIGSHLGAGSHTYRIYLDLCDGCALRAVYGDTNHVFILATTGLFFNNLDRGKTYGHQINNSALDENTAALDSWLAMGAASNQRCGILKEEDTDGSIVGGTNNDGGSAEIVGGLLANADPNAGIPLTQADGLVPLVTDVALPPNFNVLGDDPATLLADSTRAGLFQSYDFRMGCSTPGVKGPTAANKILVAQLTTTGDLRFHLNVEVEKPDGNVIKYVASDSLLQDGETASGLLNYPPLCGCMDPNFLEYDPSAGCDDGSCHTPIVFGCRDSTACNFDANANFNVEQLCCYGPGDCNGLDPALICADLGIHEQALTTVEVYPNPTTDRLFIRTEGAPVRTVDCTLLDVTGRSVQHPSSSVADLVTLDLSPLAAGTYVLRVLVDGRVHPFTVLKQ